MDTNKKLFRTTKDKPLNMIEFKPIYIAMIKHICNVNMIQNKQQRDNNKKQIRIYNLNTEYINEQIELDKFSNPKTVNFDEHLIEQFNIIPNDIDVEEVDIWDD